MGIRILLIEDDELIGTSLARGLREEGYSIEHAADRRSGWAHLVRGGWDLIVLDWWLPAEDGITLLRRFRESDRRTPVLFLTARDAVSERVRGLDAGADDYLWKPFDFEELLGRVRSLLRRSEERPGAVLERATATFADFSGANFKEARLSGLKAQRSTFADAAMTNADLSRVLFHDCVLTGAQLGGANLQGTSFKGNSAKGLKIK